MPKLTTKTQKECKNQWKKSATKEKCVRKKKISAFMKAAKQEGFLKKGEFKPLPKKGTAAYQRIINRVKKENV